MKRYAALSDIHGNRWALEAVLKDIGNRGIECIINLGDSLYGPLDPAATAEMLMQRHIFSVQGNEDKLLLKTGDLEIPPTLHYALENLSQRHIEWLRNMPPTRVVDKTLFACHATPYSDIDYFFWDLQHRNLVPRSLEDMNLIVRTVAYPVMLCGHDHTARSAVLSNDMLVVNPGSVGLPAYTDDIPYPHVMQAGSPHARYAIISKEHGEWNSEQVVLDYDWEAAAVKAAQNGRQDWASWLRTGQACVD